MQNLYRLCFAAIGLPIFALAIACTKSPEEAPDPVEPPKTYPDKNIYTNVVFPMDEVPYDETSADISAREARLFQRKSVFFAGLDQAISSNTLNKWLSDYYKQFTSDINAAEPYTVLALHMLNDARYTTALKPALVEILRNNIPLNIGIFNTESEKDKQNGFDGKLRDLNTVHPVRYALESAYALKRLDSYDQQSQKLIEDLIVSQVENQTNYFRGTYKTTGYNKELFATDIAFWVKMLYGDQKYPLTAKTFESIWENVTVTSYDGDNSPHYDSTTGFYLVLRWGLLLGRENELKASPHIRRLIDRMAKTVLTSGQTTKFAKSMENLYSSNKELALDGGRLLAWDLKVGYLLYGDPNYLYIARKYEDLRFNALNITRWKAAVYDIWPEGINFEGVSAMPTADFGKVHITERITSRTQYNGLLLGRGDADYKTVQDKIFLSTGSHPNAPSLLIDLSYTQSKAATDNRIGITSYQFMSAHVATVLGRPGEPFRLNRPMVAPTTVQDFPVFKVSQGDVTPSADYLALMGYNPSFDYIINDYKAAVISEYASYCDISYSKFEYDGVSARRQVILLHNGIAVVHDHIRNNGAVAMNAATIYTIWPSIEIQDERWIMQTGHVPTTVSLPLYTEIPMLFYFPQTASDTRMRVVTDEMRSNYEKGKTKTLILEEVQPLQPGQDTEMITVIIPVKNKTSVGPFIENIICDRTDNGGYLLYLPSPSDKATKIFIGKDEKPMVDNITPAL